MCVKGQVARRLVDGIGKQMKGIDIGGWVKSVGVVCQLKWVRVCLCKGVWNRATVGGVGGGLRR